MASAQGSLVHVQRGHSRIDGECPRIDASQLVAPKVTVCVRCKEDITVIYLIYTQILQEWEPGERDWVKVWQLILVKISEKH